MTPSSSSSSFILPFDSPEASLALAGGKGASLARLFQAGFPVPGGFIVTTRAYDAFVAANCLEDALRAALPSGPLPEAAALEAASARIRALFQRGRMPADLTRELLDACRSLGGGPVAVRSSATAEDLPEMSFAGQQDTFLNVLGPDALLESVTACWSSLWTARAIGYRIRNHVPQEGMSLAVVVQRMVESEASGVLFTANPLTGLRGQAVVDAAFGLGEALVSGQVEPDHYVVDTARGRIVEKTLGAKALSIHGESGGGTRRLEESRGGIQALPDEQIISLADMGSRAAALYAAPQDIEWAFSGGQLYLLQSRPVTSLFPVPRTDPGAPTRVMFSFAAVQGMMDPVTPLGRSTIQSFFASGAGLFGIHVSSETQTVVHEAGERLWVNVTPLLRNTVGRRLLLMSLGMVEPTARQAVVSVMDEPAFRPERSGMRPKALFQTLRFARPMAWNVLLNMLSPDRRRERIVANGEQILADLRAGCAGVRGAPREQLLQAVGLLESCLGPGMPRTLVLFISGVASAMASLNFLRMLMKDLPAPRSGPSWDDTLLELTRGIRHNPTTEMDLRLWDLARAVQSDPALLAEFGEQDARVLARRYGSGEMSAAARGLIDTFLASYGGRGFGEIDLGRERWQEDPTHVFEVLSGYLRITRPDQAPDAVFARGESAARAALDRAVSALRKTRGGWLKARLARFLAGRLRRLMGLRERPKFFMVRLMSLLREPLLQAGEELAAAGELDCPDDVFYLTIAEAKAFALGDPPAGEPGGWRALISRRRDAYRRELLRRQVPKLLLTDGRAFYEGIMDPASSGNRIVGSPVSPGRAEGCVRVVLDPRRANLSPGEILVCPGTDPSWTPLFLTAAGLVMETGGMMTHGAVVAREYGIPAIVGVHQATTRLQTGQCIRIDGSSGAIDLLDEPMPEPARAGPEAA